MAGLSQWRSVDCGSLLHSHIHGLTKPKFFILRVQCQAISFPRQQHLLMVPLASSTALQGLSWRDTASLARGWAAPQSPFFTSSPQLAEPLRECMSEYLLLFHGNLSFLHIILVLHRGWTQLGTRKSGCVCPPVLHPRAYVQLPNFPGCFFN